MKDQDAAVQRWLDAALDAADTLPEGSSDQVKARRHAKQVAEIKGRRFAEWHETWLTRGSSSKVVAPGGGTDG